MAEDTGKSLSPNKHLITLTTDFGINDSYVAQMKGAILGINPNVKIVDVTHQIPPQNILAASFVIDSALDAFPPGTVHLIVVDPGVGSSRPVVATRINNQFWVSPDNGLLTRPALRYKLSETVHINNPEYWRKTVSSTFHGRDIMGPVAAHLSLGVPLSKLGDPLENPPVVLEHDSPSCKNNQIQGEVIYIDHFGNLITNISASLLENDSLKNCNVLFKDQVIATGVSEYYDETKKGELIVLTGSSGYLELAVNQGNAQEKLNALPGQKISIQMESD